MVGKLTVRSKLEQRMLWGYAFASALRLVFCSLQLSFWEFHIMIDQ